MNQAKDLATKLEKIVDIARYAPSVHNSQPWRVKLDGGTIIIRLDKDSLLQHGDPVGRQAYISLGIFTQAFVLAAEAQGYKAKTVSFENKQARLVLSPSKQTGRSKWPSLLRSRFTDRSIYQPASIPGSAERKITSSYSQAGVKIWFSKDKPVILETAELTAKGIGLALTSPDFRRELSGYLTRPLSNKETGISVSALAIPRPLAIVEPWLIKGGIGLNMEKSLELKRWLSASGLIFITTDGDLLHDWFNAGRAYLCACLQVEELGLSQATSAATVEASSFHEDIENLLHTKQRLQCVLRVGKGTRRKKYSPRLPASALILT